MHTGSSFNRYCSRIVFLAFCQSFLKHTWLAVLVVALLVLLPVPGTFLLACVCVALLLLRKGLTKALPILFVGSALLVALAFVSFDVDGASFMFHVYDAFIFMSVALAACVLRAYGNWALCLFVLSILLFAIALYDHFVGHYWQQSVAFYVTVYQHNGMIEGAAQQATLVALLYQGLAVMLVLKAVVSIIVARAIQSKLFMPGQFGVDFRAIRLPTSISAVCALLLAVCYAVEGLIYNYVIVSAPIIVAGISLVHFIVKARALRSFWLVFFYISLALNITTFAIMIVALVDSAFNLRKKITPVAS